MKANSPFFSNPDQNLIFIKNLVLVLEQAIRYLSFGTFGLFIYQLGYASDPDKIRITSGIFDVILFLLGLVIIGRDLVSGKSLKDKRTIFELIVAVLLILSALIRWRAFGDLSEDALIVSRKYLFVNILVILIFIQELGKFSLLVNKLKLSPSLVFILSFMILILIGAALLSLPRSTTAGISFIDALFTSTSAVCVTGLAVLDTSKAFTPFGQIIIMTLFQIGGLGMMTFTTFFGFFFKGSLSIENTLFLRDYINENNVGEITATLIKIIVFTLLVELFSAILIYVWTDDALFSSSGQKWFFASFHAISAFCNAGFSTLSSGLYEPGFRELYNMHLVVAITIILGGIGFPVFINYYNYFFRVIKGAFRAKVYGEAYKHTPRVTNINTRLVMYTTGALLIVGFVAYWYFEQDYTLKGLSPYGKFVTAFFGSVTPRTAGFNTVDMTALSVPTVLIYLILMWIGASPGSTGGGLKTSTFAVAVLNTWSIASGRTRVEIFGRQITAETLRKAFAVIALSFLTIGFGVFLVTIFNPELALIDVAFEIFSAFGTVGLSLGITPKLTTASKLVVSFVMFLGRVGTLTILVAITRKVTEQRYKLPEETVFIT
ncbi:ATPase [Algoriphagus lacus]|uniref:ATPase n=1 Tax=Algoriphagus lacus TaxID=2056311 RepID=A0A418PW59_9BACT|nr:potassium transporter TrkG [Algoriphagus lacus]RIW18398.1 ATPase [Algoriphagus lacus]